MMEVVEGDFVIVHVDLAEKFTEHGHVDGELAAGTGQSQVDIHLLQQEQNLLISPLPVVERWHSQAVSNLLRQSQFATRHAKNSTS